MAYCSMKHLKFEITDFSWKASLIITPPINRKDIFWHLIYWLNNFMYYVFQRIFYIQIRTCKNSYIIIIILNYDVMYEKSEFAIIVA